MDWIGSLSRLVPNGWPISDLSASDTFGLHFPRLSGIGNVEVVVEYLGGSLADPVEVPHREEVGKNQSTDVCIGADSRHLFRRAALFGDR